MTQANSRVQAPVLAHTSCRWSFRRVCTGECGRSWTGLTANGKSREDKVFLERSHSAKASLSSMFQYVINRTLRNELVQYTIQYRALTWELKSLMHDFKMISGSFGMLDLDNSQSSPPGFLLASFLPAAHLAPMLPSEVVQGCPSVEHRAFRTTRVLSVENPERTRSNFRGNETAAQPFSGCQFFIQGGDLIWVVFPFFSLEDFFRFSI